MYIISYSYQKLKKHPKLLTDQLILPLPVGQIMLITFTISAFANFKTLIG